MSAVRRALKELAELDLDLWTEDAGPNVAVDRRGGLVLDVRDHPQRADGQQLLDADQFQLLRPFEISRETRGPDLVAPGRGCGSSRASCQARRTSTAHASRQRL